MSIEKLPWFFVFSRVLAIVRCIVTIQRYLDPGILNISTGGSSPSVVSAFLPVAESIIKAHKADETNVTV